MAITRTSPLTGVTRTMFIPGLTRAMLDRWRAGAYAQDAFAGIKPALREFIMTGISPAEWDAVLGGEE
jgi:hypothetical protein